MHFAAPIPWWLALLAAAGIVLFAFAIYRRPRLPLSPRRRAALTTLRALSLGFLLLLMCRPVLLLPPRSAGDTVVPILIDTSRSMRIADSGGVSRVATATALARDLAERLAATATVQIFSFSDGVKAATLDQITADGMQTKMHTAIDGIRTRFRGRRVPGVVVLSDGAETDAMSTEPAERSMPVFAIGVGAPEGIPDREVTGLTAGDPRLDQAASDLRVTAVTRGFGREPVTLSILADGVVAETRKVAPAADGSPLEERFTVFPDASHASLYTAAIEAAEGEAVLENNRRSLAISPAGRRRRLLMLSGAPGYDHSFLLRALQQDPGLDVDVIVRKGKNDENHDTFMVQAGGNRTRLLLSGFPATKAALFGYDAIVVSNMEGESFSREQLTQLAAFVAQRGGGLLLMGGRSFERRGFTSTPLEEVLPVALTDRRGGALGAADGDEGRPTGRETLILTDEGLRHPIMRIGTRSDQWKTLWATLPPLPSTAPVGGPRPGASVLAVTTGPNGGLVPVVAVQPYGRGRSMVFAGEASWRWRMLAPAADRRYDFFWRQSARWLTNEARDPVSITLPLSADAGDPLAVAVDVRDAAFEAVSDAIVEVRLTSPTGRSAPLNLRPIEGGRVLASGVLAGPGLYRLQAEARRNDTLLGSDDRWFAVGDHEREFADTRLNEGTLKRLARDSGGKYARAADGMSLADEIGRALPAPLVPQQRDLWHQPWTFLLLVALISAEWILRRAWGLR